MEPNIYVRRNKKGNRAVTDTAGDETQPPDDLSQVPHSLPREAPSHYPPAFFQPPALSQPPGGWINTFPTPSFTQDTPSPCPPRSAPSSSTQPSSSSHPASEPSSGGDPSTPLAMEYWDQRHPFFIGEPGTTTEGRMIIYPEGDNSFCPSTNVVKVITALLKSFLRQPWPTYGQVPPTVKTQLMHAFTAQCVWHPDLDFKIRMNFPRKCQELYKGAMYNARHKGIKPAFLEQPQWEQLQEYWQSPEFMAKSEQGKRNRASSSGGSLHTGGAVSAGTHKMRLEKKEKRSISIPELYKIRHVRKDKRAGEVWVEPRAQETWEKATKAIEDFTSSQRSDCASSTPVTMTREQEMQLWLEVNGGVKKGSAYGLSTIYSSGNNKANYLSTSSSARASGTDPEEITRVREEIAELKRQNEAIHEELRLSNERLRISQEVQERRTQSMFKKLMSTVKKKKKSSGKHKSQSRYIVQSSESSSES